jgi:hypothetical protein
LAAHRAEQSRRAALRKSGDCPAASTHEPEARRIAILAQLLGAERPRDLAAVVDQLTFLQLDPRPSWRKVRTSLPGAGWGTPMPAHLQQALEHDRALFEHRAQPTQIEPPLAMVRPTADLGLYLADMARLAVRRRAAPRMHDRQRHLPATGA